MARIISMPRFGATMEEGTINSWLVAEGDEISKGDVLGEIAIEKLSNDLLADEDGVVLKIVAEAGVTVLCGGPILVVGVKGEVFDANVVFGSIPEPTGSTTVSTNGENSGLSENLDPHSVSSLGEYSEMARITPKGLQLAQELGVDYHFVKGTGRFGMITREDLREAVKAGSAPKVGIKTPVSVSSETHPMNSMQLSLAKAMDNSLKSTAQTTISMDVDVSAMVKSYEAYREAYQIKGVKLTYTAILIKVVALAVSEHKLLRTVIENNAMVTRGEVNIGVAIDIPDGLVVPNIKNAHQKSIHNIAIELVRLSERAKSNALTLDDISGGTMTITNLGMFGIKYFTPILNPGESSILGIGTIQEVPTVQNGGIFVKPIMNLSLTHDHRVVNGAPAARFLQSIQKIIMTCETLFMA